MTYLLLWSMRHEQKLLCNILAKITPVYFVLFLLWVAMCFLVSCSVSLFPGLRRSELSAHFWWTSSISKKYIFIVLSHWIFEVVCYFKIIYPVLIGKLKSETLLERSSQLRGSSEIVFTATLHEYMWIIYLMTLLLLE